MVAVTEFQKRGLPHSHIVVKVKRPLTTEDIDAFISCEIPKDDDKLRELVLRHMMHGKDHLTRSVSRCRKDHKCIYGFPWPLTDTTTINRHGKVIYRRRNVGDEWVASYSPALLKFMECHINVDVVYSNKSLNYLYKYLCKGPDATKFSITTDDSEDVERIDEIKEYQHARYLSASEAYYRIFGFDITSKTPSVQGYRIHLPERNWTQFARASQSTSNASDLLRYFARPFGPPFDDLKFLDFYSKYRHDKLDNAPIRPNEYRERDEMQFTVPKKIVKRVQGDQVTWSHYISPKAGELFYLRALLRSVPAYSFEELQTVDGTLLDTFQEAAMARNLFEGTNEMAYCIEEHISLYSAPERLRFLFAQLMTEVPGPAVESWNQFQHHLISDLVEEYGLEHGKNMALAAIERFLRARGTSLKEHGLTFDFETSSELDEEIQHFGPRHHELSERSISMRETLNVDQQTVYGTLLRAFQALQNPDSNEEEAQINFYYIDGKAGRGKSYVAKIFVDGLRSSGHVVIVVGTTALSITDYERGRTAHSTFKVPIRQVSKCQLFNP
jgi:hypothetical protein